MKLKKGTNHLYVVNHFDCEENNEITKRCRLYLSCKRGAVGCAKWSSRYFDENTDIEITDPWKLAIRMAAKRTIVVPNEIIIDFMISNELWNEEF